MIWALRYVALIAALVLFGSATGNANLAMAPTSHGTVGILADSAGDLADSAGNLGG